MASRDLGSFQHLHPELTGDSVWSVKLTLPQAGAYRAFADFAPEGGSGLTLGADLQAPGAHEPKALPATSRTSTVDGYTVTLDGALTPGASSKLTLCHLSLTCWDRTGNSGCRSRVRWAMRCAAGRSEFNRVVGDGRVGGRRH
ncbi:hypothetical protein ACFQVD_09355 [Streptosporangium amethystogenes subsp. fukuiense]|uniref:Uncharacterized protein n=1 Tax=Streptosporangium amethystogenes subsp. fukuiense TaxID=698418 RepID=A0ABW2SW65_9ACTN